MRRPSLVRHGLAPALALGGALWGLAACGGADGGAPRAADAVVVARVGDARLTEADLTDAVAAARPGLDSAAARRQVVEQWVHRELLAQEARREGLDADPEVRRQLADAERSVLEAAYLDRVFETSAPEPTDDEVQAYYEANRDRLTLPEPYVRLRLLRLADPAAAAEARSALAQTVGSPMGDSLYALAARAYDADPDGAVALADTYLPQSRIDGLDEALGAQIAQMGAGAAPALVESAGARYAVAVVDRIPAGQTPSLGAVRAELVQRLGIRTRRDAEARLVQRLRSEATADGRLQMEIP